MPTRGQILNNGAGHGYTSSVESRMTTDRESSSPPSPALRSPSAPARRHTQSPQINNDTHEHYAQSDSDPDDDDDLERHHKDAADVDVDVDVNVGFDRNSRAARRKRTGKLTSFFGESSINFADPHPPPAPGFGFPAYPNEPHHSAASASATGNGYGYGARSGGGSRSGSRYRKGTGNERGDGSGSTRRKRMTRIETLDNVLGEMWRGVQAEMRRGGLGLEEGRKLGEMMGTLRRRSGGVWEEI